MMVLGINHVLKWVQVLYNGKCYTCPMKEINGELYYHFKKEWHQVTKYISEYTTEFKK